MNQNRDWKFDVSPKINFGPLVLTNVRQEISDYFGRDFKHVLFTGQVFSALKLEIPLLKLLAFYFGLWIRLRGILFDLLWHASCQ